MSSASANMRYLNIEGVRVFHDFDNDVLRVTSTDGDIPNGDFSITLKAGTKTDTALRELMVSKGVMNGEDALTADPTTDALITVLGNPKNAMTMVTGREGFTKNFIKNLASAAKLAGNNVIRIQNSRSNFIDGIEYAFKHAIDKRTVIIFEKEAIDPILAEYSTSQVRDITTATVERFRELRDLNTANIQIVVEVTNPTAFSVHMGDADNFVAFRNTGDATGAFTRSLLDSFGIAMNDGYERIYNSMYDSYYLTLVRNAITVGVSEDYAEVE